MSAVRELEAKYRQLHDLMTAVEREVILTGCSPRSAYQRLERQRVEWEEAQKEMNEKFEEQMRRETGGESRADAKKDRKSYDDQQTSESGEEDMPPEMEAILKVMFETAFGSQEDLGKKRYEALFSEFRQSFKEDVLGKGSRSQNDSRTSGFRQGDDSTLGSQEWPESEKKEDPDHSRLKQIYRQLARRLHPDHNRELTEREKELWHEAQAAYDAHDLDQLETLLALTEAADREIGFHGIMSVSRLRSLVEDFARKLRATQKALREAKKSPSWNFVEIERDPSKFAHLSNQIEAELSGTARELSWEVEEMEAQIAEWSNPRRGQKKGRVAQWNESLTSRPSQGRSSRSRGRKRPQSMTKAEMDAYRGFGKRS